MPDSVRLSRLVFGTMRLGAWGAGLDITAQLSLIEAAADLGLTTIDLADIYGGYTTEQEVGRALALDPSLRSRLQLVSKCGIRMVSDARPHHRIKHYDASRSHIIDSVENSLRALRTDHLDLLLIHRPDVLLDPDEVAEAFSTLQQAGKVRSFGVSNFTPSQFTLLHSRFPLLTNQVEASLLHLPPFEDGTLDQCLQLKLPPMIWSPFAGGDLFTSGASPRIERIRSTALGLTEHYKCTEDQLYLAWLLHHPAKMLPVIGTTRLDRVQRAAKALDLQLTREHWYELWTASTGQEVP